VGSEGSGGGGGGIREGGGFILGDSFMQSRRGDFWEL
jgi:hypothetical protein